LRVNDRFPFKYLFLKKTLNHLLILRSCWAFATVAILETYYVRKGKPLTSLSEQQLVDCSTANSGCNGGSPYYGEKSLLMHKKIYSHSNYRHILALSYEKSKGAESESAYPVSNLF
jgi:hypothetical protein